MLLNDITKKWLDAFIEHPSSALLIDTPNDMKNGLEIAEHIHNKLVGSRSNPALHIQNERLVSIEDIRKMNSSLQLKANKSDEISRICVISDAGTITREAQNSLLKVMEDTPENTLIILVAKDANEILETVRSRCSTLKVLPIESSKISKLASEYSTNEPSVKKIFMLAEGRASKIVTLLEDGSEIDQDVEVAKQFLSSGVFQRQQMLSKILDKSYDMNRFLRTLRLIIKAGMHNSSSAESAKLWKLKLKTVNTAEQQISHNVSTKLAMLSLSVSL